MIQPPPISTRTYTLFPYTTLFRSQNAESLSFGRQSFGSASPTRPVDHGIADQEVARRRPSFPVAVRNRPARDHYRALRPQPQRLAELAMIPTGLLGGSFNPAHGGHRAISLNAIDALDLGELWWLVSPGNPLKPKAGMAPLPARLASARRMARRSPIRATAIEAELGTRYTVDTLKKLIRLHPNRRFIWIMGADNLVQLPDRKSTRLNSSH